MYECFLCFNESIASFLRSTMKKSFCFTYPEYKKKLRTGRQYDNSKRQTQTANSDTTNKIYTDVFDTGREGGPPLLVLCCGRAGGESAGRGLRHLRSVYTRFRTVFCVLLDLLYQHLRFLFCEELHFGHSNFRSQRDTKNTIGVTDHLRSESGRYELRRTGLFLDHICLVAANRNTTHKPSDEQTQKGSRAQRVRTKRTCKRRSEHRIERRIDFVEHIKR